jgi:glyoxylase-like metal-dependent hydrolase (beta-lactamase superfamily II)
MTVLSDPAAYRLRQARAARPPREGGIVVDGRALTAPHLPGHSPGSVVLPDPGDGTLISGDVVYDDVLLDSIAGSGSRRYRASLGRLRDLPVQLARSGHGPGSGRRRLHAIIDRYLRKTQ